jgi:putative addiction module killer protein
MIEIRQTECFASWLERLRDRSAKSKILVRIDRLRLGLAGDVKPVGGGVSELRIDFGPGYRLYFVRQGKNVVLLLAGGDKSSQNRDIRKAYELAARI